VWVALAVMTISLALVVGTVALSNRLDSLAIQREKVCAEHNQGQACRDLFTRLANNISPGQRRELACAVFEVFASRAQTERLVRDYRCPRP
jgi:hypothetical protein